MFAPQCSIIYNGYTNDLTFTHKINSNHISYYRIGVLPIPKPKEVVHFILSVDLQLLLLGRGRGGV